MSERWLGEAADPARRAVRAALDDDCNPDTALAKQRVWNRVQAPWAGQPHGRRWWAPLLVMAGAAAVAAAVFGATHLFRSPAPVARIVPRTL